MACLGVITCDSDIEGSPFIIADKGTITSAEEEIEALGTQISDAITQIESEISSMTDEERKYFQKLAFSLYLNQNFCSLFQYLCFKKHLFINQVLHI